MSAEPIRLFFDPLCPWAYQTSRFVRRLAELDVVEVSWGLFSLELVNADSPLEEKGHARSAPALRTLALVRDRHGDEAIGALYRELGALVHQHGEPIDDLETVRTALKAAELSSDLVDDALADEATWTTVVQEHHALVADTASFGVPTIVLDGGTGPAIFGPVISEVPTDEDAVELWRHVSWLTRYENFSELKRDRTIEPDLESVRQWKRTQAEAAEG